MKIKKILFSSSLMTPIVFVPTLTTSCSVYQNLMNDYTPSYEQLTGTYSLEEGVNKWFEKAKTQNNLINDEIFWSHAQVAKVKSSGTLIEYDKIKITYEEEYTTFSTYIKYSKIVDSVNHKLSYRMNSKVETKEKYYLNGEYQGYGITHYSIDWEVQNLAFNAKKFRWDGIDHDLWLIKPVKFNDINDWTDYLSDDEKVTYNAKWITEIYDKEGLQYYGYEASEAAIMDKDLSYESSLGGVLDYFCCFFSYYLNPCKFA